jgi:hypothetical protein
VFVEFIMNLRSRQLTGLALFAVCAACLLLGVATANCRKSKEPKSEPTNSYRLKGERQ